MPDREVVSRDWRDFNLFISGLCLGMGLGSSIVLITLFVGGVR